MPINTKIHSGGLADNAVTTAKVIDDAVTETKVADNLGITTSYHKVPVYANDAARNTGVSNSPAVGMIIYNTDKGVLQQYNAQGWAAIDTPPTISSLDYPGDDTALDIVGVYTDATCDYNNDPTITHDANTKMKVGMSVTGTGIPTGATIASITSNTSFELSASTTGGAVTNGTLTFNSQTLVITGTNFQDGATVLIDGTAPSTVTRNSSTQITVTGTPAKTAGTKSNGLVVTNPTGLSGSVDIDYSALPAWTTASGNVLSAYITGSAITSVDLAATDATSYALTTGALAPGLSMSTSTGDITGTITGSTYTTYNFTVTATDAEAQSSPRLFNIITKALPTGGNNINTVSSYKYHTFTAGGNFVVASSMTADVLVVAGGAGGGGRWGGGGGAGGLVLVTGVTLVAGTYAVTIGTGGAGGVSTGDRGVSGGDSTFIKSSGTTLTAKGGSGGTAYNTNNGIAGGSTGGTYGHGTAPVGATANQSSQSQTYTDGALTHNAGYAGGQGAQGGGDAGGGGGAGSVGVAGALSAATWQDTFSDGGDGLQISWATEQTLKNGGSGTTAYYFAGGGGGAAYSAATNTHKGGDGQAGGGGGSVNALGSNAGGLGGTTSINNGGNGARAGVGGDAGDNTGSGGGAGTESTDGGAGDGGSGIVVIRYAV